MAINSEYLEKLIVKMMLENKHFSALISNTFVPEYFDILSAREVFTYVKNFLKEYNKLPAADVVSHSIKDASILNEIEDISSNTIDYDWLIEESNNYLKEKAIKAAILDSVEIIEKNNDLSSIRSIIEDALVKDLKFDMGLDYWSDLASRLKHILETNDDRLPTYFHLFDEYLAGGFPKRGQLGVIVGATFGGKSLVSINFAARQALKGHTALIFTFEMDEYAYANRADGIFSGLDVNKIYTNKTAIASLVTELKNTKEQNPNGRLIIKDMPTGKATVNDLIVFIHELHMRDIRPDIIYVDYIGIMKGRYKEQSYLNIKELAEELRAMSLMFKVPVITFHQLNRSGRNIPLKELSGIYIAESAALEHTADFVGIIGIDDDEIIYENTLYIKIVKNRISGRKGIIPFYVDFKSLKMYGEEELDKWIKDAQKSGDERKLYERE